MIQRHDEHIIERFVSASINRRRVLLTAQKTSLEALQRSAYRLSLTLSMIMLACGLAKISVLTSSHAT